MKLLILTQAVDRDDPVLGFFHEWISALASRFESIEVICLKLGDYSLPENVRVHSLGKEEGNRTFKRIRYLVRFYRYLWNLRNSYDSVFVHMNQEYILLGGVFWKALGKRTYLWRNHYAGTWLTDVAASFCTKVFCTSRFSYTAKFRKHDIMPVGVDARRFSHDSPFFKKPHSILFLARMAPSKDPATVLDSLRILAGKGFTFTATFVGSPPEEETAYGEALAEYVERHALTERITFMPAVTPDAASVLFRSHEVFVNASPSGMFDKTLFEAAASGCSVLARSADFAALVPGSQFADAETLAERLTVLLSSNEAREELARRGRAAVDAHSLERLAEKLSAGIVTH